ncbi:MAG: hypothetical protein GX811_01660 [Lentisphaerae bacterium]|nr:hypothetical protein [Lentisphaerota bacterium]
MRFGVFYFILLLTLLFAAGCEKKYHEHQPPTGEGSLVLDNRTSSDINLYLDGKYTNRVYAMDYRVIDLTPGAYRLVLEQRRGTKYFGTDIDVLEDRLTILDIYDDGWQKYEVITTIRKPK